MIIDFKFLTKKKKKKDFKGQSIFPGVENPIDSE